jgi:hypothetical protein
MRRLIALAGAAFGLLALGHGLESFGVSCQGLQVVV